MEKCEDYDATIIYAGKEEINVDVVSGTIKPYFIVITSNWKLYI